MIINTIKKDVRNFKEAIISWTKAASNNPGLIVDFSDKNSQEQIIISDEKLTLPTPATNNLAFIRGTADCFCFAYLFHNRNIHLKYSPRQEEEKAIFNMAERARIDALGNLQFTGSAKNIQHYHLARLQQKIPTNSKEEKNLLFCYVIYELIKEALIKITSNDTTNIATQEQKQIIKSKIAGYLPLMANARNNQEQFAILTKKMLLEFAGKAGSKKKQRTDNINLEDSGQKHANKKINKSQKETKNVDNAFNAAILKTLFEPGIEENKLYKEENEENSKPGHNNYKTITDIDNEYKVFTREFDEVIDAKKLASNEEIIYLRRLLDEKLALIGNATKRHANRFTRKLVALQNKSWLYSQEEGIIDTARLSNIIADLSYSNYYKFESAVNLSNTIVTLLLDNSGSMRGRPITVAAMCADILTKTLENCQIKTEILGFTSVDWKGGKSRKKWQKLGAERYPGRLNDLRHIIYKPANMSWRKAKSNLGVMLKEGLLKENIDGEAILWAASRMALRPEKRKILMVISDGAPVDDSTFMANSPSYLDNHLRKVIKLVEQNSAIELIAIGIGHDVTKYYKNSVTIADVEQLGSTMFNELAKIVPQQGI